MRKTIFAGVVIGTSMALAACSGGPVAPSVSLAPAALAVARFTVLGLRPDGRGNFWCAVSSLALTETGGRSGAWVTGLQFHLVDGSFPVHKRVGAGATSELVDPPDAY